MIKPDLTKLSWLAYIVGLILIFVGVSRYIILFEDIFRGLISILVGFIILVLGLAFQIGYPRYLRLKEEDKKLRDEDKKLRDEVDAIGEYLADKRKILSGRKK